MNRVDQLYKESAINILEHGASDATVGTVRPTWEDGASAHTLYLPQQIETYYPNETPITSYRRIAWKTAIKEILWIYQDRSNDVRLLKDKYNVHYWDEWMNEEGNLGKAYGYQINKTFLSPESKQPITQIDRLIEQLKTNPMNRRLVLNLYNVDELSDMTLIPCAFMTLWTVVGNSLHMTLIQRSGDFLAAASPGGINALQYYALLRMISQVTGYRPGQFVHFVQNLHIYERHIPITEKILSIDPPSDATPKLCLNPDVTDFYDFKITDFSMEDYHPNQTKFDIPIAI